MSETNDMQKEYSCGVGQCKPKFLGRFATSTCFMVVYGILGLVQAMAFIYFIATLTTLEKRFRIPTQTTGILMSGNEISQILLSIYLAYRGGKGHRPLWIATGVLFSSISCFILALPHFLYGAGSDALALTKEYADFNFLNSTTTGVKDSASTSNICSSTRNLTRDECSVEMTEETLFPLINIFLSQFVLGIGTSLFLSVGQTYMDDNTKKKDTPLLLGFTLALRSVGPAIGFVLGYACLNVYIDPSLTPFIKSKDPRWLGAWWMGWVLLGSAMALLAFCMSLFPKVLAQSKSKSQSSPNNTDHSESLPLKKKIEEEKRQNERTSNEDHFFPSLKRVLSNKLLMFNNMAAVFYILGASGYMTFYTKYSEVQFHTSAAEGSMIAGVTTVTSMAFGFLISGFLISKFKPSSSLLLSWNLVIGFVYIAGEVILLNLGCESNTQRDGSANYSDNILKTSCINNCSCDFVRYSPVCNEETGQTFFSACHAGCLEVNRTINEIFYTNCKCLANVTGRVIEGPCNVNCSTSFILFVSVQSFMQLIGCSGRITTILVNYRSVNPKDKSIAQGLALFMLSLFAFIPGPIVFGRIIDQACEVWNRSCGSRGNCWVYNVTNFRIYLNATAAVFTGLAVLLDFFVWFYGRKVKFYE